ncbi:MAG: DUF6498-containing protein [Gemmatimonadaceae bacterium]
MALDISLDDWKSGWPDALAFALGLAVARWAGWNTGDLVWSLWLSSLVVGYSTIVWAICQPAIELTRASWRDTALTAANPGAPVRLSLLIAAVALFFLAFFTVHFGGFHYVHSQILLSFFPITLPGGSARVGHTVMATYIEVARRYWIFLPSAFLSHRAAFLKRPLFAGGFSATSIAGPNGFGSLMTDPYRNVMRMHALIFFFFIAHFAGLENFVVYAVVYAVYFFPWRLVHRTQRARATSLSATSNS